MQLCQTAKPTSQAKVIDVFLEKNYVVVMLCGELEAVFHEAIFVSWEEAGKYEVVKEVEMRDRVFFLSHFSVPSEG